MANAPNWAATDRFDIEAKADGTPTSDQIYLMMQSLLLDRFKIAAHRETRELQGYALVTVKDGALGSLLRPSALDCRCLGGKRPA